MASSAISKRIVVLTLTVSFFTASAQCNLDKQVAKPPPESQRLTPVPNYTAWLDQDVRWIITDEERAAFKRLRSDEEREQFIQQFWLRRDPTPGTFLNEFKQEHYRRLAYVNEHFKANNIPAWRTDQGRLYVLFGPPDQVSSVVRDGPRTETWRYRQIKDIGENIKIDFVDRCQCREFVIQKWEIQSETTKPKAEKEGTSELRVINVLERSPTIQFKDLDEIITHKICMNLVPVQVSTNQTKVTGYTTLVPITVNVKDGDVAWKEENGERWRALNIYGRISAQNGRIEEVFEGAIRQNSDQAGEVFSYEYTAPLRSGSYRINVVVKDVAEDRTGTWSSTITIP